MSFFQNVFESEFRGSLFSADRRLQSNFKISPNSNSSMYMLAANSGPYDLTGNTDLSINYAYDPMLLGYATVAVDVSGSDPAATTSQEIVSALNSNAIFAENFLAVVFKDSLLIKGKKDRANFKAYISNSDAEQIIGFNAKAPVVELPSYFEKYAIENRFSYQDLGPHRLILLDPSDPVDAAIITAAGLDPLTPTPDWKLLRGNNDAFWFYKRTYTSGQLTSEIKYPAGASEGDLAKKTFYEYDGSDLVGIMETPYVLQTSDLITP
jgi:hypothetical protein